MLARCYFSFVSGKFFLFLPNSKIPFTLYITACYSPPLEQRQGMNAGVKVPFNFAYGHPLFMSPHYHLWNLTTEEF